MKCFNQQQSKSILYTTLGLALVLPATGFAQGTTALIVPIQMSLTTYLIIGFLLVVSLVMFFLFQQRYKVTAKALDDVTGELGITRSRLTETNQEFETEKAEHKATADRYTRILFDAEVGMFQMDLSNKCTFINAALQDLSGLYPKKALKEGLPSAMHPNDKKEFMDAWDAFTASNAPSFEHAFRFLSGKNREVHTLCKASKVYNDRKEVESYIGWVSDVTPFHEQALLEQLENERLNHFISETVEGFYKLTPDAPIPLSSKTEKISAEILSRMTLEKCNSSFAAMYGTEPEGLMDKTIGDLKDGCGPFHSSESVLNFIKAGYQATDQESIRQDASGNRLTLLNNVTAMIEDNTLIGIWGTQRNISQLKREKAELSNRAAFMQRILNSLPADVHVKDTRCRYLYASKKMANRTGIAQSEWLGKTIFEVMPGTPREHDQLAIEAMKSGKLKSCERKYDAQGNKGWMENHQVPMVSEDGLVEGVISLTLDISKRKKEEEQAQCKQVELETKLTYTQNALADSQSECRKTATDLSDSAQQLKLAASEKVQREQEFQATLTEQKRTEEILRRNEQGLLTRQKQLEEQLSQRLAELNFETDKRRKWEELLSIKEDELLKLEENLAQLSDHYKQESARREQAETNLEQAKNALANAHRKVAEITESHERELEQFNTTYQQQIGEEQEKRIKAEKHLARTSEFLESTQLQVLHMTDQHASELEKEIAERKDAAEKLIQSMTELEELRKNFSQRIHDETKDIKRELAQKQIREKALRKHDKDQEQRIKDLENTLQLKLKEFAEQIQAREGAEVEKNQIEQQMEQLSKRQQEQVDNATQKLNLSIAEIRLNEVKLRKHANELEGQKERLEERLRVRENFLEKARQEQQKTEAELKEAQARLSQLKGDQSKQVAQETHDLKAQLKSMEQSGTRLQSRLDDLQIEKNQIEQNLNNSNENLSKAAQEYRKVVDAYNALQRKLESLTGSQKEQIARQTAELKTELKKFQRSEQMLQNKQTELNTYISGLKQEIDKLNTALQEETNRRYDAETALRELEVSLKASQENANSQVLQQTRELKAKIEQHLLTETQLTAELEKANASIEQRDEAFDRIKQEHEQSTQQLSEAKSRLANIDQAHKVEQDKLYKEAHEIRGMSDSIMKDLSETIQQTLNPVVESTKLLEQSSNLSDEQKRQVASTNYSCKSIMETINNRLELSQLSSGMKPLDENEFDLHKLIAGIDQQFTHRAETNKLFFAVSYVQFQDANNVPKHIIGDAEKLEKSLSILLGYALSKTKKGRLGLHAKRQSAGDEDKMHITFEMAYTPAEANDDLLKRIFNQESEAATDFQYGLTLARRYIKLMGGETSLEFREAGVTALTLNFPFAPSKSEMDVPKKSDEKQAGAA